MPYDGLTKVVKGKAVWNGKVITVPNKLVEPIRWQRPRLIFVNSMSDLFHNAVPFETIAAIFGVMAIAHWHTFQILTKRDARMLEFFEWLANEPRGPLANILATALLYEPQIAKKPITGAITKAIAERGWPLPNVWLGVSAGDRVGLSRIHALRQAPAHVRWVSVEPQIEDLGDVRESFLGLDWIVQGGESAPQGAARWFNVAWARSMRDQCKEIGTPYFLKQLGTNPVGEPWVNACDHKGKDPDLWPEDMRVREWPR